MVQISGHSPRSGGAHHTGQLGDVITASEGGYCKCGLGTSSNQPTGHLMYRSVTASGNHPLKSSRLGPRQLQRVPRVFGDPNFAGDASFSQTSHKALQTLRLLPGRSRGRVADEQSSARRGAHGRS